MEKFSNEVIYIIISIVILVFSAFSNKRKKERDAQAKGNARVDNYEVTDQKPFSLEDIFRERMDEEEVYPEYHEPRGYDNSYEGLPAKESNLTMKEEMAYTKEGKIDLFEEKRLLEGGNATKKNIKNHSTFFDNDPDSITLSEIKSVKEEEEYDYNEDEETKHNRIHPGFLLEGFSIKKAIIFSEILKPKFS